MSGAIEICTFFSVLAMMMMMMIANKIKEMLQFHVTTRLNIAIQIVFHAMKHF